MPTRAVFNDLNLQVSVVAGAAANTNIAISGIATDDVLLSVVMFEPDNGVTGTMMTDKTSTTSITSAGNIQNTGSTSGKQLLVIWHDVNA